MNSYSQFQYPYFEKGQVLKSTDLNAMVSFLDMQNRLTRVLVVGSGIFSGLEASYHPASGNSLESFRISQGFGLSSDGFIIQMKLEEGNHFVYTHFRPKQVKKENFQCGLEGATDGNTILDTYELITQEEAESDGAGVSVISELITKTGDVNDFCLVLWVSEEKYLRPNCIDVCEQSGGDLSVSIKALLVPKSDLEKEIDENGNSASLNFPPIYIKSFGYKVTNVTIPHLNHTYPNVGTVRLTEIASYDDFKSSYRQIISSALNDAGINIMDAYRKAFEFMSAMGLEGIYNPFESIDTQVSAVLRILQGGSIENGDATNVEIQYLYHYLHDLKRAYEEFISVIQGNKTSLLPKMCTHARYISLASVSITSEIELNIDGCRSEFKPSQISSGNSHLIKQLEFLYEKMKQLASISLNNNPGNLELPLPAGTADVIRIIPSRNIDFPLSAQSIPVYYNSEIKRYWSYRNHSLAPDHQIFYYRDSVSDFPPMNQLIYFDKELSFYRIEGHLGKNTQDALEYLNIMKDTYNLPFSIKVVYLSGINSDEIEIETEEMQILKNKYVQIRAEFITYLESYAQLNASLPLSVFPLSLENYDARILRNWITSHAQNISVLTLLEYYFNILQILDVTYDLEDATNRERVSFSAFADANPGLQSLGGVEKGGTFVLVNAISNARIPIDNEIVLEATDELKLRDRLALAKGRSLRGVVADGDVSIVVGDLALPYISTDSDYIVEPIVILTVREFCDNDNTEYEVWTYPSGGVLKGRLSNQNPIEDVPYLSYNPTRRKHLFNPSYVNLANDSVGELQLTYQFNGLVATTEHRVYKKPANISLSFNSTPVYTEGVLTGRSVTFIALGETEIAGYWIVNGVQMSGNGDTSNVLTHVFSYNAVSDIYVKYVVKNGICSSEASLHLSMCELIFDADDNVRDVSLQFTSIPSFTNNPEGVEQVGILVEPAGGLFELLKDDGEIIAPLIQTSQSGLNFTYTLINTPNDPLEKGLYMLRYYLPACPELETVHPFTVTGPAEVENPELVIQKYRFASIDRKRYPIYYRPSGSSIIVVDANGNDISERVLSKDGDRYFFVPQNMVSFNDSYEAIGNVILTPMAGSTISKAISVVKIPDQIGVTNIREVEDEVFSGFEVTVEVEQGVAERYNWQKNDTSVEIKEDGSPCIIRVAYNETERDLVIKLETVTTILIDDRDSSIVNNTMIAIIGPDEWKGDDPGNGGGDDDKEPNQILNERRAAREEELGGLGDTRFQSTNAYGQGVGAINESVANPPEVRNKFVNATQTIIQSYATTSDARKVLYFRLLQLVTESFLDKVVYMDGATLNSETITAIINFKARFVGQTITPSETITSWNPEVLRPVFGDAIINEILSAFEA